jgi:hypothetical protein
VCVAAVLIVAIVAPLLFLGPCLRKATLSFAEAFRPRVNFSTTVFDTLESLKKTSRLVVLTAAINVEVVEKSQKTQNLFGYEVDLGTTEVRLRALENKVQFFVALTNLSAENFSYDPDRKRLTLRVPRPVLDEDLVEVQSDPAKIEVQSKVGWARLDKFSGKFLRTQAQARMRSAVIHAGGNEAYVSQAMEQGRASLKTLLRPVADLLKPGVELDVEFR